MTEIRSLSPLEIYHQIVLQTGTEDHTKWPPDLLELYNRIGAASVRTPWVPGIGEVPFSLQSGMNKTRAWP